jgi:hypothetical protein
MNKALLTSGALFISTLFKDYRCAGMLFEDAIINKTKVILSLAAQ